MYVSERRIRTEMEKIMKKKLIGAFVASLALIGSICSVNATTYSKTKIRI